MTKKINVYGLYTFYYNDSFQLRGASGGQPAYPTLINEDLRMH